MMFCPKCGAQIIGSGRFCAECGARIRTGTEVKEHAPPGAPSEAGKAEGDIEILMERARDAMAAGDYNMANKFIDEVIKHDPYNDKAWNNKGVVCGKLGRYREAVECFDRGIQLNPNIVHLWFGKGSALCALNKYREALACFDRALQLRPDYERALQKREECLSMLRLEAGEGMRMTPEAPQPQRCAACGYPLIYLQQYQRWYCNYCRKYAGVAEPAVTEGGGAEAQEYFCTTCRHPLVFLPNQQRWYCRRCMKYQT